MLTYGFYNSINHDRVYDAVQMSSIFDGIINDGVYMSIGDRFFVELDAGLGIIVGTGRAWFDHTWTLNDTKMPMVLPAAEPTLNRIDAVVLEVNSTNNVRANSIKIIKGTPATNPSKPTMVNTKTVHQHPLAYISVSGGATSLKTTDLTIAVGTKETPYVTGIIETVSVDYILKKWEGELSEWFEEEKDGFVEWEKKYLNDFKNSRDEYDALWRGWFYPYINENQTFLTNWLAVSQNKFDEWFNNLQAALEPEIVTNLEKQILDLQNEVGQLQEVIDTIREEHMLLYYIDITRSDGTMDILTTETGEPIYSSTPLCGCANYESLYS